MTVTKQEVHTFLNNLRDSGVTNMWGAVPYLQEEFDMGHREAKDALIDWIESLRANA